MAMTAPARTHVRAAAAAAAVQAPAHSVLSRGTSPASDLAASSGSVLDPAVRGFMESGFRHDFSHVRIHADAAAARRVAAVAYTVGRDIVFDPDRMQPHTPRGRAALAHELAHVVQNDRSSCASRASAQALSRTSDASEHEADRSAATVMAGGRATVSGPPSAVVQTLSGGAWAGIGIAGAIGAGFGIAALAGAFSGDSFSDEQLQEYLKELAENGKPVGGLRGDNKARAVVKRWQKGAAGFTVLTIPVRILLIQEMADGYLSEGDQDGILALLTEAIPAERAHMLPAIDIDHLKQRFDGDRRKRLDVLLENHDTDLMSLDQNWTVPETRKVVSRHGDGNIIQKILAAGYKIFSFQTAFDKWRFKADGHEEEQELKGLLGNTDGEVDPKRIRLRETLKNEQAASTLFHEGTHAISPDATTQDEYLEGEIHARVEEEGFRYRHGMPPDEKDYRTPQGKPNEAAIRKDIRGSSHYNPQDKERIDRRYVGEQETTGWDT